VLKKSAPLAVDIRPIGALTLDCNGKDIAEMMDMNNSGAIAFSDGILAHVSAGSMLRSLLYVKPFNGLVISFPDEESLSKGGLMNESASSSMLGMKGIPNIAEELAVVRDIQLCEYAESKLHFAYISTPEALGHIRKAKNSGLNISCAVTPYNLMLTDNALEDFDTNLKVFPPLRTSKDKDALIKGLKDGIIDAISSFHLPHDTESKDLEFDLADFGMIGLETAFAAANTVLSEKMELTDIIAKFSLNPRCILGLKAATVKEGNNADLTIFDNTLKWKYDKIVSKSKNTPFKGTEFTGRVLGIINKGQAVLNN
jgi:dihydroorotase